MDLVLQLQARAIFSYLDQRDYARLLRTSCDAARRHRFMLRSVHVRTYARFAQLTRFLQDREYAMMRGSGPSRVSELRVMLDCNGGAGRFGVQESATKPMLPGMISSGMTSSGVRLSVRRMRWCCDGFEYSGPVSVDRVEPHGIGVVTFPSHVDPAWVIPTNVPIMGCSLLTRLEGSQRVRLEAEFRCGRVVRFIHGSCDDWSMERPACGLRRVTFRNNVVSLAGRALLRVSFDYNVVTCSFDRVRYLASDGSSVQMTNQTRLEPSDTSLLPDDLCYAEPIGERLVIAWLVSTRWTNCLLLRNRRNCSPTARHTTHAGHQSSSLEQWNPVAEKQ